MLVHVLSLSLSLCVCVCVCDRYQWGVAGASAEFNPSLSSPRDKPNSICCRNQSGKNYPSIHPPRCSSGREQKRRERQRAKEYPHTQVLKSNKDRIYPVTHFYFLLLFLRHQSSRTFCSRARTHTHGWEGTSNDSSLDFQS